MNKLHMPTQRVGEILKIISQNPNKLNLSKLSKELNIPKSTLSPILKTLINLDLLDQNKDTKNYLIGILSFQIGHKYLENISWIDIAKKSMKKIVQECNEICQLAVNLNNQVNYIAKVESKQSINLMSNVGRTLPLHSTALGRIFLSNLEDNEIKKIFKHGLESFNKNTVSNLDELFKILKKSKEKGYSEEIGEMDESVMCIAFPIKQKEKIVAAISVSLPIFRATDEHIENIIQTLKSNSEIISNEISHFTLI